MKLSDRTPIAVASASTIAFAVVVAFTVGEPGQQRFALAVFGVIGVAMTFPSLFVDPRELLAVIVCSLPSVMALASGAGPEWLIGPLAVLLLVGSELNAFHWESEGPPALRGDGRRRLLEIGRLALLGLVASSSVTLAMRLAWLDSIAAVAVAAAALAGVAWVVLPSRPRETG